MTALLRASDTPAANSFEDVLPASTFYSYVETAFSHDIIGSYPCGGTGEPCDQQHRPYFRPSNNITRGQLTKLLNLARGWALYTPSSPTFADVPASKPKPLHSYGKHAA